MTTIYGTEITVTSVQLRMLADKLYAGDPDSLTAVWALPRQYLTLKTMAAPPWEIADRLRMVARFIERYHP